MIMKDFRSLFRHTERLWQPDNLDEVYFILAILGEVDRGFEMICLGLTKPTENKNLAIWTPQ